jgi:hypothetical protein
LIVGPHIRRLNGRIAGRSHFGRDTAWAGAAADGEALVASTIAARLNG